MKRPRRFRRQLVVSSRRSPGPQAPVPPTPPLDLPAVAALAALRAAIASPQRHDEVLELFAANFAEDPAFRARCAAHSDAALDEAVRSVLGSVLGPSLGVHKARDVLDFVTRIAGESEPGAGTDTEASDARERDSAREAEGDEGYELDTDDEDPGDSELALVMGFECPELPFRRDPLTGLVYTHGRALVLDPPSDVWMLIVYVESEQTGVVGVVRDGTKALTLRFRLSDMPPAGVQRGTA
jgi:hypothetical protein